MASDKKTVPTGAAVSKRPRNEKENEAAVPPARRTKYIFNGPTNTLSSTPLKQRPKDDSNRRKSPSKPSIVLKTGEHPSSDDHIFWAPTPRESRVIDTSKLPSSPLEDFQRIKISPVNPINSFPHRFEGINFDNISTRSPEANRTAPVRAQSFTTTKKPLTEKTKRLLKSFNGFSTPLSNVPSTTKKKDISSLIRTVERGFSASPFDKLGDDDTPSKLPETVIHTRLPKLDMEQSVIKEQNSSDVFDDDDFSDDFLNDLDKVLEKKSTPAPNADLKEAPKPLQEPVVVKPAQKVQPVTKPVALPTVVPPPPNKIEDDFDNDFDDDFSDLDDELDELLKKPTQTQAKLTTQEKLIQTVDRQGLLIFKKDIAETDTKVDTFKRSEDVNLAKTAVERPGVHRFQVVQVLENHYMSDGRKKPQKMLRVKKGDGALATVFIRDFWQTLSIEPKDVIHIIGEKADLVDKESDNLLVWNPDVLLSATLVSDTISCLRRSVLKTRFDSGGDSNIYLVVGEVVHRVFQTVLKDGNADMSFMEQIMDKELDNKFLDILIIQETKESVRASVREHLPYIKTWFDLYMKPKPALSSSVRINRHKERALFSTSNIIDIEENIWSPMFGLRGLIDVTIEAHLSDLHDKGKFAIPMELKSGARMNISHKSQAALYTLLMKDRYDMDVNSFMLVYTKLRETIKNEIDKRELKDLMMLRNVLSEFMKQGSRSLPDLVRQSQCDRCYAQQECMTLSKLNEEGTEENSGLAPGMFTNLTEHLDANKEKYAQFFNYWDDLVTKEEGTINLLKKDLFLTESTEREKTSGKCLSNLVISASEDDDSEEDMLYVYTFKRKPGAETLPPMNGSQLTKHDRIMVSDENGHFALCSGFIVNVRPDFIVVRTDRRLKNNVLKAKDFNIQNNQTFQTVLKPLQDPQEFNTNLTYRIDKDEMFHGMRLARFNLLNLFLKDGDQKRRELIVDGKPPTFAEKPLPYDLGENHHFNSDQIKAFDKVLSANDFSLLLGMPGTGKTTVIAQLIRFLVQNGKTVLLTSYTHSAVDNILMKIKEDGIGIVRLGSLARVHQDVRCFSPYKKEIKTSKDLKEVFLDPPVVATTCLGINDWVFRERKFDYCIVDESSQVSMPVCLGPLRFCDKFVLVGDHYQLPPLIQNSEAKAGLSKSLFKILSEQYPEVVVDLSYQYRMCSDIMLLSNTIIYEGRLKCGTPEVANQSLVIPKRENMMDLLFDPDLPLEKRWMETVLDEHRKVIFLNHDYVGDCEETSVKENIENAKEAELVYQVVESMLKCGVPEESIGVMSFYRAQLRLFYRKFVARKGIEMLTADQFQGRDKDCVIISLVKSNNRNDVGSLLKEWRRLNVSITRAKSKLIIIGSKRTLKSLETLDAFIKILESRGWFYDLPAGADTFYNCPPPPPLTGTPKKSPKRGMKKASESKVIQKNPLAREIAAEMGL